MDGELDGKVALVTGAARGQGRAHAVRLARAGADVVALDVCAAVPGVPYPPARPEDLAETAERVRATGRRCVAAAADVRGCDALRAAVDDAVDRLGRLDVVVANAGVCVPGTWDELSQEDYQVTIDVNVTGTWNTIRAAAPHLIASGGGSIVVISSTVGLKAAPFLIPYTASKFALTGMAKGFAAELARHRIRVNSVHPSQVVTAMGTGLDGSFASGFAADPHLAGMFGLLGPQEPMEPEEVAETVLYLVSDRSRHVTAHALAVDAGASQF